MKHKKQTKIMLTGQIGQTQKQVPAYRVIRNCPVSSYKGTWARIALLC